MEEAIRTMALFGIVLFLIWPAVDLFFTQSTTVMLLLFCAPLVYFPFGVWLRLRSGTSVQPSRRTAWFVVIGVYVLGVALLLVAVFNGHTSLTTALASIVGGAVTLALLVRFSLRRLQLR